MKCLILFLLGGIGGTGFCAETPPKLSPDELVIGALHTHRSVQIVVEPLLHLPGKVLLAGQPGASKR